MCIYIYMFYFISHNCKYLHMYTYHCACLKRQTSQSWSETTELHTAFNSSYVRIYIYVLLYHIILYYITLYIIILHYITLYQVHYHIIYCIIQYITLYYVELCFKKCVYWLLHFRLYDHYMLYYTRHSIRY